MTTTKISPYPPLPGGVQQCKNSGHVNFAEFLRYYKRHWGLRSMIRYVFIAFVAATVVALNSNPRQAEYKISFMDALR